MNTKPQHKPMTSAEFMVWAMEQKSGRYELVAGEVVAMAPERARHNLVKIAIVRALQDGIAKAGLPCTAFTDGMTVNIDERHSREPDAAVQCNKAVDLDSLVLDAPVIVVEVTSPTSDRDDTGRKLAEYFSLPSIQHYLIVRPEQSLIVHHARGEGADLRTSLVRSGSIRLDPPGLTIDVDAILAAGRA